MIGTDSMMVTIIGDEGLPAHEAMCLSSANCVCNQKQHRLEWYLDLLHAKTPHPQVKPLPLAAAALNGAAQYSCISSYHQLVLIGATHIGATLANNCSVIDRD